MVTYILQLIVFLHSIDDNIFEFIRNIYYVRQDVNAKFEEQINSAV